MLSMQSQSPQRRKLYQWCTDLGLTRPERVEIARYLLRRDLASFEALDDAQVLRMLDALEGAHLVSEIYRQRL